MGKHYYLNGDKEDNRLVNLELVTSHTHTLGYHSGYKRGYKDGFEAASETD